MRVCVQVSNDLDLSLCLSFVVCLAIADWRRQKVEDHKFEFINLDDYVDNSVGRKFKYLLQFVIVITDILIYGADLW